VKQAGFVVLITAYMPAVLVEVGFGSNPSDAAYMSDAARVEEMSSAIADAVLEYLQRYERRVSALPPASSAGGVDPR
jgi:N-acetylmuramoyl-L-alanine amidase